MTQTTVSLTKRQEKAVNGDKQLFIPMFKTDDYDKFLLVESNRFIRHNKLTFSYLSVTYSTFIGLSKRSLILI